MSGDQDTPPTRASLKAWWKQFNKKATKPPKNPKDSKDVDKDGSAGVVFGVPLKDSLRYASVQISTANADGELYVWGYIPVVVAKCGLYLKERATETEGVFRVSGSARRMRELQALFEAPPRYGKSLDWKKETYTTHDVASVFRRYLTMMPEPVIPTGLYHEFRDVYRRMSKADDIIQEYKRLIRSIPRSNQYLLLYVLDLLSVFARKSDKNLMTASNLAVIFRPGILAHPDHDMVPSENDLSQRVVEFLIDHQDWFMLEVPPPPRSASSYSSTHPIYRGQSPTAKSTGTEDDLVIIPSSDEERNNATTSNPQSNGSNTLGGWRLIPRRKGRTQEPPNGKHLRKGSGDSRDSGSYPPVARPPGFDRSGTSTSSVERRNTYDVTESGALVSPTNATTDDVTLAKEATVTRSRTFPSKGSSPGTGTGASNGNGNSSSAEKQEQRASNVLKKKSRARPISTQVPQAAKDIATA